MVSSMRFAVQRMEKVHRFGQKMARAGGNPPRAAANDNGALGQWTPLVEIVNALMGSGGTADSEQAQPPRPFRARVCAEEAPRAQVRGH